jgi:ABC-type proline/glycine betaine transport system substrate-binding protein
MRHSQPRECKITVVGWSPKPYSVGPNPATPAKFMSSDERDFLIREIYKRVDTMVYDKAKYKSAAVEAMLASVYLDFQDVKDKLDRIAYKQEAIERLLKELDEKPVERPVERTQKP